MATTSMSDLARRVISERGGRATQPRIATLTALIDLGRAVTHADLHARLPTVDRVSLYRALDWLAEHDLAYRLNDPDGIRRYGPSLAAPDHHTHPHFHCTQCGLTTCLDEASVPKTVTLPRGFRFQAVEMLVKGLCRTCATLG